MYCRIASLSRVRSSEMLVTLMIHTFRKKSKKVDMRSKTGLEKGKNSAIMNCWIKLHSKDKIDGFFNKDSSLSRSLRPDPLYSTNIDTSQSRSQILSLFIPKLQFFSNFYKKSALCIRTRGRLMVSLCCFERMLKLDSLGHIYYLTGI